MISYWKKYKSDSSLLSVSFCIQCWDSLIHQRQEITDCQILTISFSFSFFFLNTFIRSHVFFVFALWNLCLHIYVVTPVLLWDLAIVYYILTLLLLCSLSSRSKYTSNSHSQSLCQCVYSFCCPVLLLYIFFRNGAL